MAQQAVKAGDVMAAVPVEIAESFAFEACNVIRLMSGAAPFSRSQFWAVLVGGVNRYRATSGEPPITVDDRAVALAFLADALLGDVGSIVLPDMQH